MSRFNSSGSRSHHIQRIGVDHYRMTWAVDFYYKSSRLRWPRTFHRDTDLRGALRFARRWDLKLPSGTDHK